jgi:hypothetical protein
MTDYGCLYGCRIKPECALHSSTTELTEVLAEAYESLQRAMRPDEFQHAGIRRRIEQALTQAGRPVS